MVLGKTPIFQLLFVILFSLLGTYSNSVYAQFSDTYELMKGIENKDMVAVRSYLFKGANINGRLEGRPGLIIALDNRDHAMLEFLLENGAMPDIKDANDQETTLMIAAAKGDEEAIRILLAFGADIDMPDKQGRTPLMKAASNRKKGAVVVLIEAGADMYKTDYTGRDVMQYAQEARARSVIRELERAGWN